MGGFFSRTDEVPTALADYITERFIQSLLPGDNDREDAFVACDPFLADASQLMRALMTQPGLVSNIQEVLEFLIVNETKDEIESVRIRPMFEHLQASRTIAERRAIEVERTYMKTEYNVHRCLALVELCRTLVSYTKGVKSGDKVAHAVCLALERNSMGGCFQPPKMEMMVDDPSYCSVSLLSQVNRRGMVSNGNFLFALSHDMTVNVFPMLENGSLLPPFSRTLMIEESYVASLSVTESDLVVSQPDRHFYFDLDEVTKRVEMPLTYSRSKTQFTWALRFSDGIVTVIVNVHLYAWIYAAESDREIHSIRLCEESVNNLFLMMEMYPVEVNGVFLSVFVPVTGGGTRVMQFSLLNGKHVHDELLEGRSYESVAHDAIHHMHWVAWNNNGRITVRGFRSTVSVNPFIFGFVPVNASRYKKCYASEVVDKLTLLFLSSLMVDMPLSFRLADSASIASIVDMLVSMLGEADKVVEAGQVMFVGVLQILTIIIAVNMKSFGKDAKDSGLHISTLLRKMRACMDNRTGISLSGFLVSWLMDDIDCNCIVDEIVWIVEGASPSLLRFLVRQISVSPVLCHLSVTSENEFTKLLKINTTKPVTPRLKAFLIAHQKGIVKGVLLSAKNDGLSDRTEPIMCMREYTRVIVDSLIAVINSAKSFADISSTHVYELFDNYMTMFCCLSEVQAIARDILSVIAVLPPVVTSFVGGTEVSQDIVDFVAKLGFTCGLMTVGLIGGGALSPFEYKHQWLIQVNSALVQRASTVDEILRHEIPDSDNIQRLIEYGDEVMGVLYKKCKPAMNRNIPDALLKLDRLVLAVLGSHLGIMNTVFSVESGGEVPPFLRSVVDQVMRVRNSARSAIRNGASIDTFLVKSEMLLRMRTDLSHCENKVKAIGDFIVSSDSPDLLLHFIANQGVRLELIQKGFKFIESMYERSMHPVFYAAFVPALARLENFDGLASIVKCNHGLSTPYLTTFAQRVIEGESRLLLLMRHRLFKSGAVSEEVVALLVEYILDTYVDDSVSVSLVALCYGRIGLIRDVLHRYADFTRMTEFNWFCLADALMRVKCSDAFCRRLIQFLLECDPSKCRLVCIAVVRALTIVDSAAEIVTDALPSILDVIGNNLVNGTSLWLVSELVDLVREIMTVSGDLQNSCHNVLCAYRGTESRQLICAVFAVIGGEFSYMRVDGVVAYSTVRGQTAHAIALGSPVDPYVLDVPITRETKRVNANFLRMAPESRFAFVPSMFPDMDFVMSFFDVATSVIHSPLAFLYLSSLSRYLAEPNFMDFVTPELVAHIFRRLVPVMNPPDDIHQSMFDMWKELSKDESTCVNGFTPLKSSSCPVTTWLSDVLGDTASVRVTVEIDGDFDGYIGLVGDSLSTQVPYVLIQLPRGLVLPHQSINAVPVAKDSLTFEVAVAKRIVRFGSVSVAMPPLGATHENLFRVVVGVQKAVKLKSICMQYLNQPGTSARHPILRIIGFRENMGTCDSLVVVPKWTSSETREYLSKTKRTPPFESLVEDSVGGAVLFPEAPLLLHFRQSEALSTPMKQWVYQHMCSQLYSQWATVVTMHIVVNGYSEALCEHEKLRLFSLLLVAVEICDCSAIMRGDMPFSLENSSMSSSTKVNTLNFGLETKAQAALTILSQTDCFANALKRRIIQMNATKSLHLVTNNMTDVVFYSNRTTKWPLKIKVPNGGSECMIVSTPLFNNVLRIGNLMKHSRSERFPRIITTSTCIETEQSIRFPISGLPIPQISNTWVYGTLFEMLILLKQYMFMNSDLLCVRETLVDAILVQSPFVWPFLGDFILHCGRNFVTSSEATDDYLRKFVLLGSLIEKHGNLDVRLLSFFDFERQSLVSQELDLWLPRFPEFSKMTHRRSPDSYIQVTLDPVNITGDIEDPMRQVMNFRALTVPRATVEGFPFFLVLPIWLTIIKPRQFRPPPTLKLHKGGSFISVTNEARTPYRIYLNDEVELFPTSRILLSVNREFEHAQEFSVSNFSDGRVMSNGLMFIKIIGYSANLNRYPFRFAQLADPEDFRPHSVKVNVSNIHDDFVADMTFWVESWTATHTQTLLAGIPSHMLKQREFVPICEVVKHVAISDCSPRVVLFVAYMVHRLNYIYAHCRNVVSENLWKHVMPFISSEETSLEFMRLVARSTDTPPHITVDRHGACQLVLDQEGLPARSMIAQFTSAVREVPASKLQNKDKPWTVTFRGESAIDAGGPRRELFTEVAASIFEPTSRLFVLSPNGRYKCGGFRGVYVPATSMGSDASNRYLAIGTYMGVVIRTGLTQDLPFAPFIWKFLAGERLSSHDVFVIDDRLRLFTDRLMEARLDADFVERFSLKWTVEDWDGSIVELNRAGSGLVTGGEVDQYVACCVNCRLESASRYMHFMRRGLHENVGRAAYKCATSGVLGLLAQGSNSVTTAQLREISTIIGFENHEAALLNFWTAVERMSNEQRSLLLKFITTLTRMPNPNVTTYFCIKISKMADGNDTRLPCASTCVNRMYLPCYSSADVAFQKITYAIEACQTMENA